MAAHDGNHIVVAAEPRSYREALGGVLRVERPADEVVVVDPSEVPQIRTGDIVVCSELTAAVAERAGGWVLLSSDSGVAISSVPEVEAMADRRGLHAVLEAVDRVATSLAQLQ